MNFSFSSKWFTTVFRKEMNNFNPNQCLSPHLAIRGVDDILYEYGISLTSVSEGTKRSRINNPKLIFFVLIIQIVKSIVILMTYNNDIQSLQILGDIGVYFGIRTLWSLLVILGTLMAVLIQMVYYMNNRMGLLNEHYAILQMISGRQSPSSFGIFQYNDVLKILKYSKLCNWNKINTKVFFNLGTFVEIFPYCLYTTLPIIMTLGIINTIIYATFIKYCYQIITFNGIYFYIICKYFNIKINNLNESLKDIEINRRLQTNRIRPILGSMNGLYCEINVYNNNFWSKYLFILWFLLGYLLVLILYMITFVKQ